MMIAMMMMMRAWFVLRLILNVAPRRARLRVVVIDVACGSGVQPALPANFTFFMFYLQAVRV